MLRDALAVFTNVWVLGGMGERDEAPIPEPEFKPFWLPERARVEARAGDLSAAAAGRAPRTLEDLGVPATLALDIESALRVLGATRGERVVGFKFRSPDGASHELRLTTPPEPDRVARAA